MTDNNIVLTTDTYKVTHWKMYPKGTQRVYSYLENRAGGQWPKSVFFGLQYLLKRYLEGQVVTQEYIDEAEKVCFDHLGDENYFNREGWEYILKEHGGRLPVVIKSVDEGSVIDESNVLLTIENTDDRCFWLTNHLETLLVQLWYPCTVATSSFYQRLAIQRHQNKTGGDLDSVPIRLHDFGFRGSTSRESAAIGGAGHLTSFIGTDNLAAYEFLQEYYYAKAPATSIPAAEHSTITTHKREVDAYRQILDEYPVVSVVSDSYDIWHAVKNLWGGELKAQVQANMDNGGLLVIRPDSGDPAHNVLKCLEILGQEFGVVTNEKGYNSLPQGISVIQGDGIDPESLEHILTTLYMNKWTTDSVVYGSGGGLLQKVNRDTQRFAMKCSAAKVNGEWRDVYKRPNSDLTKSSKAGRLALTKVDGKWKTVREEDSKFGFFHMEERFRDGVVNQETETDLDGIRLIVNEAVEEHFPSA